MTTQEQADEAFVKTWMEAIRSGHNAQWAADELHISKIFLLNKAHNLRKHGIALPSMKNGRYRVSPEHAAALNKLINGEATEDHLDVTEEKS